VKNAQVKNTNASIGVGVNAWVWESPFDKNSVHLIDKAAAMVLTRLPFRSNNRS
jgi:hypothetical protein